jgi:hypothetical protein
MCWRTFANTFWRSVPTFLVLLRTEAGGAPAFQSVSASRKFFSLPRSGEGLERGRPARTKCIRKPNEFGMNAKTCWRTFANMFWRSVPTCSVLLRTEAGGTPAFQSFARFAANLMWYNEVSRSTVFGLLRSPETLFTKKAQRSVVYLTSPTL